MNRLVFSFFFFLSPLLLLEHPTRAREKRVRSRINIFSISRDDAPPPCTPSSTEQQQTILRTRRTRRPLLRVRLIQGNRGQLWVPSLFAPRFDFRVFGSFAFSTPRIAASNLVAPSSSSSSSRDETRTLNKEGKERLTSPAAPYPFQHLLHPLNPYHEPNQVRTRHGQDVDHSSDATDVSIPSLVAELVDGTRCTSRARR